MLNPNQLRMLVVRPMLQAIDLWTQAAENLVCGTALNETNLEYIAQIPVPIALGFWQMEAPTYADLLVHLGLHHDLQVKILHALHMQELPLSYEYLTGNLYAGAIFCRLKYYFNSTPIPDAGCITELSNMWGRIYNTRDLMIDKSRFVTRYLAAYPK